MSTSSLSAIQQKVASRIEKLLREKRLNENQLLHLLYIFSREEKVKITRSQNCRLLRIERYGEDTINRVTQFLDVVESLEASDLIKKDSSGGSVEDTPVIMSKRRSRTSHILASTKPVKKIARPIHRTKKEAERLPSIQLPATISRQVSTLADEAASSDVSSLNEWLVQQTKRGKQARKIDPSICCPETSTTLCLADRQVPLKKKRKKTAKKRSSQKNKEEEEEEEEVELVIAKDNDDVDEVVIIGEEDDEIIADEEADEDDVDIIDEDDDDEDDEEPDDDEQSVGHSVVDSDSGDDDE